MPSEEDFFKQLSGIFETSWVTNNGCHVQELESALAAYLGVSRLVACNNGTTAIMLAVQCAGLAGKKVALTPYTYVATLSALLWLGCTPVFVDVDPQTLCLSPEKLRECLEKEPDVAGVVPVHIYGLACDVEALEEICREHGIVLVYDGAQAFASRYNEKSLLSYGDYSICSFHATKIFHAAEGGCVIAHTDAAYKALRLARAFGHEDDTHYSLGINGKMSELHAALGLALLPGTGAEIEKRRQIHAAYDARLGGLPISRPTLRPGLVYNYAYYPILLPNEQALLRARKSLAEQGIYPRRYFYPALNTLPYLKPEQRVSCPVAENAASRVLCLPMHGDLPEEVTDRVAAGLQAALRRA